MDQSACFQSCDFVSRSDPGQLWDSFFATCRPYRQLDDVARNAELTAGEQEDHVHISLSDFYAEEDNVTRGVTFEHDAGTGSSSGKVGEHPGTFAGADSQKGYFSAGRRAPNRPSSALFEYTITTLFLLCDAHFSVGNALINFLLHQVTASITKVNPTKFSIKANIYIKNITCALKIRLYSDEPGRLAVEFQRRNGDVVGFNGIYKQASEYLQDRFIAAVRTADCGFSKTLRTMPPLPFLSYTSSRRGELCVDADIAPLLSMAEQVDNPPVQAEAAAGLAHWAQDRHDADVLCTQDRFKQLEKLLAAESPEVDYPTSQLILNLAQHEEALLHFMASSHENSLLTIILETLQARLWSTLARRNLAEAVRIVLEHHRARGRNQYEVQLSKDTAHQLASNVSMSMEATLKEWEVSQIPGSAENCEAICQSLREASVAIHALPHIAGEGNTLIHSSPKPNQHGICDLDSIGEGNASIHSSLQPNQYGICDLGSIGGSSHNS